MSRGRSLSPIPPDAPFREDAEALRAALSERTESFPSEKWGVRELSEVWKCSNETAARSLNGKRELTEDNYRTCYQYGIFIRLPRFEREFQENELDKLSREELYALVNVPPKFQAAAEALKNAGLSEEKIIDLANRAKDRPELVQLLSNPAEAEKAAKILSGTKEGGKLLAEMLRAYAKKLETENQ